MSTLLSIGVKGKDGKYQNFTISINDASDRFGNNVTMYRSQSKEERDAKKPKEYIGNGKVFWTDGVIKVAEKPAPVAEAPGEAPAPVDDLPF